MTSKEKPDAGVQAKLNMYDYATFVETDLGVNLCTLNLRLLTFHSYNQQEDTTTGKILTQIRFPNLVKIHFLYRMALKRY